MSKKDRMRKNAGWRFGDIVSRGGDKESAGRRALGFAKDVEGITKWVLGALGFIVVAVLLYFLIAFLGLKAKQAGCEHLAFNHDKANIEYEVDYAILKIECANCKKDFEYKVDKEKEIVIAGSCIQEGHYNVVYNFGVINGVDYTIKKMHSSGYEDHDFVVINEGVEATCGWPGQSKLEECSVCYERIGGEYLEPLGHDVIDYEDLLPTCQAPGRTGGRGCSRCEYRIEQEEIIDQLEHTHVYVETKEATYNTSGYKRYLCSMCNIDEYKEYFADPLFANYATFGGNDTSITIFSAKEGVEHLDIPDTINDIPVVSIGQAAFMGNITLKSVKLPNSLQMIDDYAFSGCINLESIEFPRSLNYIGVESFANCVKLVSLTIPERVYQISSRAFSGCSGLVVVNLNEGLQVIDSHAFNKCINLLSIKIPSTVYNIEYGAFLECTNMVEIYDQTGKFENRYPANIIVVQRDLNASSAIVNLDDCLFVNTDTGYQLIKCINNSEEVILPDTINGEDYEIKMEAFKGLSNVKKMTIPQISQSSFDLLFELPSSDVKNYYYINIIELTVKAKEEIVSGYFNLPNLKKLTITNDVVDVRYGFDVQSLEELVMPSCDAYRVSEVFFNGIPTTLTKLSISSGETIKYDFAKGIATLKEVILPDELITIGQEAFFDCISLESIILPKNLQEIQIRAFQNCTNLIVVYNLSNLDIKAGDMQNGFVSRYATVVYNSLEN